MKKTDKLLLFKGFAMGVADIIPGVSGGTVAFITGVYDKLLEAVANINKTFFLLLFRGQLRRAFDQIHWRFLAPLGFGIICAVILMSRVVHYTLENYPEHTWGLFLGLISSSILLVAREAKGLSHLHYGLCLLIGTVTAYALVSTIPIEMPHTPAYIFISGCIAVCAMILPGVSGSFFLLLLGQYAFVTGLLRNPFAPGHAFLLVIFLMGCSVGLIGFSKILNYLVKKHRAATLAILTGFMIGSLKKLWPWKKAIQTQQIRGKIRVLDEKLLLPAWDEPSTYIIIALILTGALLVLLVERYSVKK